MGRPRRSRVAWSVLALAGAAAIWGYTAFGSTPPVADPSLLARVSRETIVRSVVATGRIEPITSIEVKSKANGIIEKVHVDVDDVVEPGAVLVELDKENLNARLREARANLQAAEAAHAGAVAALRKNEVEAEAPDVDFARRARARAQELFDRELIAQSGLDEATSALEQGENRQRAAQGQLLVGRARVAEALAIVAQATAAVERAAEELANATIRAPIRGTVLTRDVEVGSPVSSILNLGANATLVMRIGDVERVFVRGRVDESDIGGVRLGQRANITTESFRDRVFGGRVTQISPLGVERDNVTTFEVEVSIDNPGGELKANMSANAEIVLEEAQGALVVPEAAVTYDTSRAAFVDVVSPGGPVERVGVELGIGTGTRVQVLSGLTEGQQVLLPR